MGFSTTPAWETLGSMAEEARRAGVRILDLFGNEPDRMHYLVRDVAGIHFDFSKLPLARAQWLALSGLAAAAELAAWRDRMASGEIVNRSEARAATHMQLRHHRRDPAILKRAEEVRDGAFGHYRDFIHIGIGGSALGPQLLLEALAPYADGPSVHVATNIDGEALARLFRTVDPHTCGLIAVSKTMTTLETRVNLESACRWLAENGVARPIERVFAVTADPKKAREMGVPEDQILAFGEEVGGRYSIWSAVGFPVAVANGPDVFTALLDGAAAMDRHFMEAPCLENAPVMAALADVWAAVFRRKPTRSVFAYDERLRLLPPYLQQLEMESNGKSVCRDGRRLECLSAPITWGGTGTDAQHAVFQLLHQGTHDDPIEFVAVREGADGLDRRHRRLLLANCLAQGAALLRGRTFEEALADAGGDRKLAAARTFPGNRGSTTILLDRLDARTLGALLSFYEARTFSFGTLLGINPFDQWGVELGKDIANRIDRGDWSGLDPSTAALMRLAGLAEVARDDPS